MCAIAPFDPIKNNAPASQQARYSKGLCGTRGYFTIVPVRVQRVFLKKSIKKLPLDVALSS